jgi:hypothetical protein
MRNTLASIGLALSLAFSAMTTAQTLPPTGGLPPWHFGMTPQEVTSQLDAGPYKSFTNGDLETYNGTFDGRKENVQLFFKDGKLVRIGVYLYEGEDIKDAGKVWANTYRALKSKYGAIELPDVVFDPPTALPEPDLVGTVAQGNVAVTGKSQMAPFNQPPDAFVFASFRRDNTAGHVMYYVTVMYDPPHR